MPGPHATRPEMQRLAEHLPAAFCLEAMDRYKFRTNASGRYLSAWAQVDYALCQTNGVSDEIRDLHLEDAARLLQLPMQARAGEVSPAIRLGATILCAYLPVFKKRAHREEIIPEDLDNLYTTLGAVIEYSQRDNRPDALCPPSQYAEIAFMGLSARTRQSKYLLYPSSPSWEASHIQPKNHDLYAIGPDIKIPREVKTAPTNKEYEPPIKVIYAHDLVTHIRRRQQRLRYKQPDIQDITIEDYAALLPLMVHEARDNQLLPAETAVLNAASGLVVQLLLPKEEAA